MVASHELRKLRKQQASERRTIDEQRERIRQRMAAARDLGETARAAQTRRHNAVVTGLVPRIGAAINSWTRQRVPFRVEYPAWQFSALTDFRSIRISIPELDGDMDVDFAADLRGLAYHEAGHILKSMPFPALLDAVVEGPPGERRHFLDNVVGVPEGALHHAWNMLEDQRMETAMVQESVNLARYYNVIVLTHVLKRMTPNAYLLLYGRKHVDADVRAAARTAFLGENGPVKLAEAEHLIDTYKASNDPREMWECVVRFGRLVDDLKDDGGMDGVDSHDYYTYDDSFDEDDFDLDGSATGANEDEDDTDEASKGGKGDKSTPEAAKDEGDADGEGDEDESEGQGEAADRNQVGEAGDSDGPGAPDSKGERDWSRDLLAEALERAMEERRHDGIIVSDVKAYNEALRDAKSTLPIKRIPALPDPNPEVTVEAIKLNQALRNIMNQAREQTAPTWQGQQRRGVLDIRAYATRQPGNAEIFRDYAPGGDLKLPDMAVSVVLDGSGSMLSYDQALSIAAFGIKSACQAVDVPCTVTVYDTDAYLLWDANDNPREVPHNIVPNGGTDPTRALDLLDVQKHDKRSHLVIIMTDGAWQGSWGYGGTKSLADYQAPDREMVMFYYKVSPSQGPRGTEACAQVGTIRELSELPKFLRRYLMRAL